MKFIRFNNKYYKGFSPKVYEKLDFFKNKDIPIIENDTDSFIGLYATVDYMENYNIHYRDKDKRYLFGITLSKIYFNNSLIEMFNLIGE